MSGNSQDYDHIELTGHLVTGLLKYIIRTWATAVEVFVRRDFGSEYLGNQAASVILLIPVYIVFSEGFDPRPMLGYLGIYLFLCFCHRINVFRRTRRGEYGHRFYNGASIFQRWLPMFSESTMKRVIEPIIVFGIAAAMMPYFPTVGLFLIGGAFCSSVLMLEWQIRIDRRARDMNDAVIEQEAVTQRFREMRNDRFR